MGSIRCAALAAAATLLFAAACSGEDPPTYDRAFQADFVRACRAGLGSASASEACGCWYETLTQEVPFEELPPLEDLTAAEAPEDVVDPGLYEYLADCAGELGGAVRVPATVPPPLTVPRPTTTTTVLIAEG